MEKRLNNVEKLYHIDYICRILEAAYEFCKNMKVRFSDLQTAKLVDEFLRSYDLPANAERSYRIDLMRAACTDMSIDEYGEDVEDMYNPEETITKWEEYPGWLTKKEFCALCEKEFPPRDLTEVSKEKMARLKEDYIQAYEIRCTLIELLGRLNGSQVERPGYVAKTGDGSFWKIIYVRGIPYEMPVRIREMEAVLQHGQDWIDIEKRFRYGKQPDYLKIEKRDFKVTRSIWFSEEFDKTQRQYPLPADWKNICKKNRMLKRFLVKYANKAGNPA